MNRVQQSKLDRILREIPRYDFYGHPEDYEIKEMKVHETEYFTSVVIVTGMKNDEGTWASILCRKHRHFFIGKRGGITTYVGKRKRQLEHAQAVSVSELLIFRYTN